MDKVQGFSDEDKENCTPAGTTKKVLARSVQLEMNMSNITPPGLNKFGGQNGNRKAGTGIIRSLSMRSPITSKLVQSVKRSRLTIRSPLRERHFNSNSNQVEFSGKKPQIISKPLIFDENAVEEDENGSKSQSKVTTAVDIAYRDPLLAGDYSCNFVLPILENGKLSDIKEISGLTLTDLMSGKYDDVVDHYEIIDCRYPYEYLGGHIRSAINLPTQQEIFDKLLKGKSAKTLEEGATQRIILIFHCEFSSQRGPGMARYLRGADRSVNLESYPALHYPEFYVLSGGYLEFFQNFPEFCSPRNYVPMDSPVHAADLHEFRLKSKDQILKSTSSRHMKKKLGSSSNLSKNI